MNIYAVHDHQVDAYSQPFYSPTDGSALRAFADHVNDPSSPANKHPEDYSLHQLGTWDDNAGEITGTKPRRIGTAQEYKTP
ncbi:MAG: nonstructural protein [Microvirus sp.]|nr:MAG: nonstructural protein [Microvirus sp.]